MRGEGARSETTPQLPSIAQFAAAVPPTEAGLQRGNGHVSERKNRGARNNKHTKTPINSVSLPRSSYSKILMLKPSLLICLKPDPIRLQG